MGICSSRSDVKRISVVPGSCTNESFADSRPSRLSTIQEFSERSRSSFRFSTKSTPIDVLPNQVQCDNDEEIASKAHDDNDEIEVRQQQQEQQQQQQQQQPQSDEPVDEFQAYLQRMRIREKELKELYEKTPKRERLPLPDDVHTVRPFLSSTFRDFNAERDIMTKTAFPRIEHLCTERGVFFTPLDLRWGVTSEQSGSGHVIKICLEEIDRCRPWFVGSLGFRNGWALSDEYTDELLEQTFQIGEAAFPWLTQFRDRSVTEAEMLHGALNDPQQALRALFYFRSVAFLEKLDESDLGTYCDIGLEVEEKLDSLKRRVILAGFSVKWFDSPNEMVDRLEEDLVEIIEHDFPHETMSSVIDHEVKDHEDFAKMQRWVHVIREQYFSELDTYLRTDASAPYLVVGPNGCGKSAFLSNWIAHLKSSSATSLKSERYDWSQAHIISRYVGITPGSSTPASLIRWIMEEMRVRYELEDEVPINPKKMMDTFPEWLETATRTKPLILVLDGISSLSRNSSTSWILHQYPQSVKVVCSTVTGSPSHTNLRNRDTPWNELQMLPLKDEECLKIMHQFLGLYGKAVDENQQQQILSCDHTRNPLYLTTFLQEMRTFGVYEKVNDRIDHYLEANSVDVLFTKVLERLEEDFESAAPNLVRYTLSLLHLAREGLNEKELRSCLELGLGYDGTDEPFPVVSFSALMLRLDANLMNQRGRLAIAHMYLRNAVEDRYLRNGEHTSIHLLLAKYFEAQSVSRRSAAELPFHLYTVLFAAQSDSGEDTYSFSRVSTIQSLLGNSSLLPPVAGRVLLPPTTTANAAVTTPLTPKQVHSTPTAAPRNARNNIARSLSPVPSLSSGSNRQKLSSACHPDVDVESLSNRLREYISNIEVFGWLKSPQNKWDLHKYWKLLESVRDEDLSHTYIQSLQVWYTRENPPPLEYATKCEDIATFLIDTNRYAVADTFLSQAIKFRVDIQGELHADVGETIAKRAELYFLMGNYKEALPLFEKSLHIEQQVHGQNNIRCTKLQTSIASILKEMGRYNEAQKMYEEGLRTKTEILGDHDVSVAVSMSNLGELHLRMHQPQEGVSLLKRSVKIMRDQLSSTHPQLASVLSSLASAHSMLKNYDEALRVFSEALFIKETVYGKDHVGISAVLNNIAGTHHALGDHEQARALYERSLDIRIKSVGSTNPSLVPTLMNLGASYDSEERLSVALDYYERALHIIEQNVGRHHHDCVEVLNSIGSIHMRSERYDLASRLYTRVLRICERTKSTSSFNTTVMLVEVLAALGNVCQAQDNFEDALPHFERAVDTARRSEQPKSLVAELLVQTGATQLSINMINEAIGCFTEALALRQSEHATDDPCVLEVEEWLADCQDMKESGELDGEKLTQSTSSLAQSIRNSLKSKSMSMSSTLLSDNGGVFGDLSRMASLLSLHSIGGA